MTPKDTSGGATGKPLGAKDGGSSRARRRAVLVCAGPRFEKLWREAFETALNHILRDGNELHVATVVPRHYECEPGDEIGTQWMAENLLDEASAKSTLKGACESLSTIRRGLPGIAAPEQHLLTPAYGVSPTAAAIVQFSRDKQMDLLVVGASDRPSSDIFQATKLAVGFKSISDYCIANASCSVLAVRRGTQAGLDAAKPSLQPSPGEAPGAKRQICVICDGSRLLRDMSAGMLRWVLQHLYSKDSDQLHIITIEAEQSSKRVPRGLRDPPNRTADATAHSLRQAPRWAAALIMKNKVPLDDVVCAELGYPELAGEGDPLCTSQGEAICRYIDVMRTSMLVVPYLRKGPGLQCCAAPCFAGVNNAFTACSNFCIREAPCSVLVWRP